MLNFKEKQVNNSFPHFRKYICYLIKFFLVRNTFLSYLPFEYNFLLRHQKQFFLEYLQQRLGHTYLCVSLYLDQKLFWRYT